MNRKNIYKVKVHIDINDGLYRYNFDDEYMYSDFLEYYNPIEVSITVDCLLELEEKHGYKPFKKGKRLFSKKEYLEISHPFVNGIKVDIKDIKSIKYIVEYEPCCDVTIDFLAKKMNQDEFLDYVSDRLLRDIKETVCFN